ncbi:FMN-binding protein [Ruminococcus sp. NK3A76]|uniref:FMN-binding protein n=1 Tax=Ruminococcus sp. NK3A76 TaxID=877411 RepID=UPI00048E9052|nr:FMN-binding protein [Ruminococcus sp. NK3A76]
MLKRYILPPLVLTLICAAVSGLLALAYDATYVDETGVLTAKLITACDDAAGNGEYEMLLDDGEPVTFGYDEVSSVIIDKKRDICFIELTEDGYSTGGLHFVVGIEKNGIVMGVGFVSNTDTPGLGSKVSEKEYLAKYKNLKNGNEAEQIDNVTSATYSSKGLKRGIALALDIYHKHKGEIFR